MESAECGAAALAIVFAHHRHFVPLESLREECGVSRDGTNAARVLAVARRHGFLATGFRKSTAELRSIAPPAILHWNFDHFVVLEGFSKANAWINDPALGRRVIPREELDRCYTGVVLELRPGPDFRPRGAPPRLAPMLFHWLAGSRAAVAWVAILGFLLIVPGVVVPLLSRTFVDQVLAAGRGELVRPLLIGMALTALLRGLLTWLQGEALARLSQKLVASLSSSYLKAALRLPHSFHLARHPSDIGARVEIGDRLSWLLSGDLPGMALSASMVIFYATMMLWLEPRLAAVVFAFALTALALDRADAVPRAALAGQVAQESARWLGVTVAGLQAIETLKANGIEASFLEKWSDHHSRAVEARHALERRSSRLGAATRYLHSVGALAVLAVGSWRVMDRQLTVGTLVAFQSLLASFTGPLEGVARYAGQLEEVRAQVSRFRDVLDHPSARRFGAGNPARRAPEDGALRGTVEFRGVTFGYDSLRPPFVADLAFRAEAGSRIAIVGRTGSGKSTIARLVSGLVLPWSGEILLDGRPRPGIARRALRSAVATVEQEIHLFEGTIAENLALWDPSVTRDSLLRAARDACLDGLLDRLPAGLDTRLTEGGRNLSGGERQRLALARALARDPAVLVLDEATSALDPETELRVHERLLERGCTCLIVAHRLSAIRDCDEILMLDSGLVTERGRHEELWDAAGSYRELILAE